MAQGMLVKVRALLDNAESYESKAAEPHSCKTCDEKITDHRGDMRKAAETYRAKAHALMEKFQLEQEKVIAHDPTSVVPIRQEVEVCSYYSEYRQAYINTLHYVAKHAGVRVAFSARAGGQVTGSVVGYESDIRYAETIFTAARLVFVERMEPRVQRSMSDQENVYRLRSAGMERVRVAEEIWGNRDKANLAKVGRYYKSECARRGEAPALDGRGVTGKVYREQYAEEFPWALHSRLTRARDAAGQYGGGLVLHGRQERVDEAFYSHFPEYRPRPAVEQATTEDCGACAKTKHASGKCKDHRPYVPTKADRARSARYYSAAAQRGREAGTAAANHVQLDRSRTEQVGDGGRGDVERVAYGSLEG
jgi:hypothetical protein